jgi:hypothetical protein
MLKKHDSGMGRHHVEQAEEMLGNLENEYPELKKSQESQANEKKSTTQPVSWKGGNRLEIRSVIHMDDKLCFSHECV